MPETLRTNDSRFLTVLPRGGSRFVQPCQHITPADLPALQACADEWPQENRAAVDAVRAKFEQEPDLRQYLACETAFFAGLPAQAVHYALPPEDTAGLLRFGADGLVHAWVAGQHPRGRIVSVHLAAQTTLAAICDGAAVDCSVGYSLLDGLPGLTSCGEIDPSLLFFLCDQGVNTAEIRVRLYTQCGWRSFAKRSFSFAEFLAGDDPELSLARSMYFHGLIKQIGAMLSVLGGADRIVFVTDSCACCEEMIEQVRCHFSENKLDFATDEIKREDLLLSLLQTR